MRTLSLVVLCFLLPASAAIAGPAVVNNQAKHDALKDWVQGKIRAHQHPHFVLMTRNKRGYMQRSAAKHLEEMVQCARNPACSGVKSPVYIHQCSRFRSHKHQRYRWLDGLKRLSWKPPLDQVKSKLRYLALPGTSRHHWGTDVDFSHTPSDCKFNNQLYRSGGENKTLCREKVTACMSERNKPVLHACKMRLNSLQQRIAQHLAPQCRDLSQCHRTSQKELNAFLDAQTVLRKRCTQELAKVQSSCEQTHRFCFTQAGAGARMYGWLKKNASRFGFCQPYKLAPEKRNSGRYNLGYQEERWHWSYCCEAKKMQRAFNRMQDQIAPTFSDVFGTQVKGKRKREELAKVLKNYILKVFPQYVNNIHADCMTCAQKCE
jgi:LAS superfamily LD-carboxypeptidase LdcB